MRRGHGISPLSCLLRVAALLLIVAGGASLAVAQAVPTATGPGTYVTLGAMGSYYDVNYGDRKVGGISLYADANLSWRVGIEAKAQSLRYHEEFGKRTDTYLVGPKISFRTHRMIPYAKTLVGLGRFRFPYSYGYATSFVVAPGGGVDYRLTDRVTVRLVDAEYQLWPEFPLGSMHPYGVSAGVSIGLWRPHWRPGWRNR